MEDHPGVVNTDNSIPSDPGPSGAMASVIRQVIKDNLRNKYHNNSKSSYFVIKEIDDGASGDNGVVSENMVSHIYPRMICMYVCMYDDSK